MGWSVLVHDTTATGNVTRVFHGFDAPDTAVVIDSSEDWYSGDWFSTSRNSCLTLADMFRRRLHFRLGKRMDNR